MLIEIPYGKEIGEQNKRVFYSKSLNVTAMHFKKIFFRIYDIFFFSISSLKRKAELIFHWIVKRSKEIISRLSFMMKIKASEFQPVFSHERRLPKSSQFLPECSTLHCMVHFQSEPEMTSNSASTGQPQKACGLL